MKKKKIIIIMLLIVTSFLLSTNNAKAYDAAPNDCVNNDTCMLLCNYRNEFTTRTRIISIYYYLNNGQFEIDYWNGIEGENSYSGSKGPSNYSYIFSNSGRNVYSNLSYGEDNFLCPSHGYIDNEGGVELCFGTTEFCEGKSGLIFTKFGSETSTFISEELDYNFGRDINDYYESFWQTISDDISNGNFDILNDLENKLNTDFSASLLKGYSMPAFIANHPQYINGKTKLIEEFNKQREIVLADAEEDFANGDITEGELEDIQNNWNYSDEDFTQTLEQTLELTFNNLQENIKWAADFDATNGCISLLGNPEVKSTPAYYLQIVFSIMKYLAIILLFILTIMDLTKAVASNNQDALKKVISSSVKRIIIVIILLFLPSLIKFLLTLLGAYSPGTCGIS